DTLGRLLGLGLVEEVELDVGIALRHRRFQPKLRPLYPVPRPRKDSQVRAQTQSEPCRTPPPRPYRASSSSGGTGRSGHLEPAGPGRSGSPGTSRTVSTSR